MNFYYCTLDLSDLVNRYVFLINKLMFNECYQLFPTKLIIFGNQYYYCIPFLDFGFDKKKYEDENLLVFLVLSFGISLQLNMVPI